MAERLRVKDVIREFKNCVIIDLEGGDIKFISEDNVVVTNDPRVIKSVYDKFVELKEREKD